MNLLLKSARIIDKKSAYHLQIKDILIEKGSIQKIANNIPNPGNFREIQLENLHVSTGWFDSSVSLGEPGFEERETISHGLEVAAKSGITAVAVNSNTHPLTDHKAAVEFLIQKAATQPVALYPIASLTRNSDGKELAELYDMSRSGAIAFGDYNRPVANSNLMKIALLYAQNFDGLVMSFPQDNNISSLGFVNESANNTRLGLKSVPALAEELQITRDLFILEYTGGKLHIPTISTAKSVKLIKEAKKKGLGVTCSVSAHHLLLTDAELDSFDANYKVLPPLRSKKDVNALRKGVKDGTIDIITSDHNPIDIENKKLEFERAAFGTTGMESLFAAANSVLDTETAVEHLSALPRAVFRLPELRIAEGEKANLSLFNPETTFTFSETDILSTSKNSAFTGKKLKGKVYGIFTDNQLILNE